MVLLSFAVFLCFRPSPNIRGRPSSKKPAEPVSKFRATPAARPSAVDSQRSRKPNAPSSRNSKVICTVTCLLCFDLMKFFDEVYFRMPNRLIF